MLSVVRSRLTYANVVATLALVFAMSGGALAASHYLITSTKQIKPGVLNALKGKAGPTGAQGPAGPAGPAGPGGAKGEAGISGTGAEGKEGHEGKHGENGEPGESVITKSISPHSGSGECKEGGSEFMVGSGKPTFACNGSPWTAGGTLPPGSAETGVWSFKSLERGKENEPKKELEKVEVPISFPIPLAKELEYERSACEEKKEPCRVHAVKRGEENVAGCGQGTVEHPEAEPGNLCIYEETMAYAEFEEQGFLFRDAEVEAYNIIGTTGGLLQIKVTESEGEQGRGHGTWAMTAE
jgi:hypothetical protein